jgi:hypothetical protein
MDLKVVPVSVLKQMHTVTFTVRYVSDRVSDSDLEPDLIRIQLVLWIRTGNPDLDQEGRNDSQKRELHEILWFEELNVLIGGLNSIAGLNSWTREEILYIAVFGQRSSFFSTIDL